MALGDDGDFRMVGFRQIMRFPPQDVIGGTGSILGRDFTTPSGGNIQQPGGSSTNNFYTNNNFNQFTNNSFTNNTTNNTINNYYSCDDCSGGGGPGSSTISVEDSLSLITYSNISTLRFAGTGFVSVTENPSGTAVVNYKDTTGGGGGGGSTLKYGEIISSTKLSSNKAIWSYQVKIWSGGVAGSTVTAYNTLERKNTSTLAYGYTVDQSNGQRINLTNYAVSPVPNGAFVVMESTNDITGISEYWFSAPNRVDGTCT